MFEGTGMVTNYSRSYSDNMFLLGDYCCLFKKYALKSLNFLEKSNGHYY